ncbi:hypothetical protein D3C78_1137930 [compost metagenome]
MMHHVNLRLSDEQLEVVEMYRKRREGEGLRVTRSDAIRALMSSSYEYKGELGKLRKLKGEQDQD